MKTLKLDGVDYEAPEQTAQAFEKQVAKFDEQLAEAKKASEALQARLDAAAEKLTKVEAELAAAKDPKVVSAAVSARLGLERAAAKVLGAEIKLDELADDEIKRKVVLKVSPAAEAKIKECSAEYLQARFDQALESDPPKANGAGVVNQEKPGERQDASGARDRMIKNSHNAWTNQANKA